MPLSIPPVPTFARYLESERFKSHVANFYCYSDFMSELVKRLPKSAREIDTRANLMRWAKERFPSMNAYNKCHVEGLWAAYLEWHDKQPRPTHAQIRESAGASIRQLLQTSAA